MLRDLEQVAPKKFLITFTIQECFKLKLKVGSDTPSPYATLSIFDNTFKTKKFEDQENPVYNQEFKVEVKMPIKRLIDEKVEISLWHNPGFFRSHEMIGNQYIDLYEVYKSSTHKVSNRLVKISKDGEDTGMVKFTALIISEEDTMNPDADKIIKDNDEDNPNKKTYQILNPDNPLQNNRKVELHVTVFKGEFNDFDTNTEYNLKVRLALLNEKIDTYTINSKNPAWRSDHTLPVDSSADINILNFELIQDESKLIGRFYVDYNLLKRDGAIEATWYYVYGPEADFQSIFQKFKYKFEIGTHIEQYFCLGRVLVEFKRLSSATSVMKALNTQVAEIVYPSEIKYVLWFDVYEFSNENDNESIDSNDQIFVDIQFGNIQKSTKAQGEFDNRTKKFRWAQQRFESMELMLPEDESNLPDIFIRIYRQVKGLVFNSAEKEYLAFSRIKAQDLITKGNKVSVEWERLRLIKVPISGNSKVNYLGLLLCSLNLFRASNIKNNDSHGDEQISTIKRPIVVPTTSFKRYKLITFLCMGVNIELNGSELPDTLIEVSFNGKSKRTKEDKQTINPVWNQTVKITTILNESLELSDRIKLSLIDTSGITEKCKGSCEISITDIVKYNNQKYIDKELYKLAKWYNLYSGVKKLETKVLAEIFIVKLVQQGKESIMLTNKELVPSEADYRLYFYSIGIRGTKSANMQDGYLLTKYHRKELETKDDKTEFFRPTTTTIPQSINYNNFDKIGEHYSKVSLSTVKDFIKNIQLLLYSSSNRLEYWASLDIQDVFNKKMNSETIDHEEKIKKIFKKPKTSFNYCDELTPLYKNNTAYDETSTPIEMLEKSMRRFGFNCESINSEIGDEIIFDCITADNERRGLNKPDQDDIGINRPELDSTYENELPESQLPFHTSALKNKQGKLEGLIRYFIEIVKEGNEVEVKYAEDQFNAEIEKILDLRKNNCFIARIYLLNVTNLRVDDNVEEAYVWIKRWNDDFEYKEDKKTFKTKNGNIDKSYSIEVVWPDSFFISIEFYQVKNNYGIITESFIGSTEIDLERRLLHPLYQQKLSNQVKFKHIPIEARNLYSTEDSISRGALRLWVEIVPKKQNDLFQISALDSHTIDKYELRLIVWNTRSVPLIEGKVNIQVKINMHDGKDNVEQLTDTHYNSKDGSGEFNYRIVIPFLYPSDNNFIEISVYNDNEIAKDQILGNVKIDMRGDFNQIHKNKSTISLKREWVTLEASRLVQKDYDIGGEVEIEVKLLTIQDAERNKVGKGWDEPNKDPELVKPINGRNMLDRFSAVKDLGEAISNYAGSFMGMVKFFGVLGIIVAIAYAIKMLVS